MTVSSPISPRLLGHPIQLLFLVLVILTQSRLCKVIHGSTQLGTSDLCFCCEFWVFSSFPSLLLRIDQARARNVWGGVWLRSVKPKPFNPPLPVMSLRHQQFGFPPAFLGMIQSMFNLPDWLCEEIYFLVFVLQTIFAPNFAQNKEKMLFNFFFF